VFLVHGEPESAAALKKTFDPIVAQVAVPQLGDTFELDGDGSWRSV
jgi:hypothetical protein